MPYRVQFSDEEMEVVWSFAGENGPTQMQYNHYNSKTKPRPARKVLNDCFIGKIGEWAWDKYCVKEHGMAPRISWKIRPKGGDDICDFIYSTGIHLEVKAAKSKSNWLLLPTKKIKKANMFLFTEVGWTRDRSGGEDGNPLGWVDIHGFIPKSALINRQVLNIGDLIPGTSCPVQQDNYATPIDGLYHSLPFLVKLIREPKKL